MMRPSTRMLWLVCAIALIVAAASGALAGPSSSAWMPPGAAQSPQPSPVIFPARPIPIRFDHAKHTRMKLVCSHCHPAALTSTKTSDRLLPKPTVCDACHGAKHPETGPVVAGATVLGACATCHEGWQAEQPQGVRRMQAIDAKLRSNHAAHARRKIGCGQCHGAVQQVGQATTQNMPRMRGCQGCHDLPAESRGDARSECTTCHLQGEGGRMQTHLPGGVLRPPRWLGQAEHGPDFARRHAKVAGDNSRLCASCHGEDDCARCHDGRMRDRSVHPNDWLSMHAVSARQNSPRCDACHRAQSFCRTCHLRAGVTASGSSLARAQQGRFHPPADVFTRAPKTARHHAWEAQRNLSACVSCHSERDCAGCHASRGGGGLGVNPHGPGFLSRCGLALRRNPRPCLVCHDLSDAVLGSCR